MDITQRQRQIVKAVVEKYIETAEPVGSVAVEKGFSLGVSPATLRNEMASLEKMGYLQKTHASAGRIPTSAGLKLYIKELMRKKDLSIKDEVVVKEKLWRDRFEFDKMMTEATKVLAEKSNTLAICALDEGKIFYSGMANILDMPEFYDIDLTQAVLAILDECDQIRTLFGRATGEEPVQILLGDELGLELLQPCGVVCSRFDAGRNRTGTLGILGPSRLHYSEVVPLVQYLGELISEIARTW